MYITKTYDNKNDEYFDWEMYFSEKQSNQIVNEKDLQEIFFNTRRHLEENKFQMIFALNKVVMNLLDGIELKEPRILELGAATGALTRLLISQYGGKGVLVDKSETSYEAYRSIDNMFKESITYIIEDIFKLNLEDNFDVVCSFGLIEHFKEKTGVLESHKKFLTKDGYIIIIIPMDSILTRTFFEVHPELNLGYRELLTQAEFKKILKDNDLNLIRTEVSNNYSYDFIAALCQKG